MKNFLDTLTLLADTPIPVLLVGGGLVFLFIAVGGQFGAKINSPDHKGRKYAAILGFVLLFLGITMQAMPSLSISPTSSISIDALTGTWQGLEQVFYGDDNQVGWEGDAILTIEKSCDVGLDCGTLYFPTLPCSTRITLQVFDENKFEFNRGKVVGEGCSKKALDSFELLDDGSLLYIGQGMYNGESWEGRAILHNTGK